MLLPRCAPLLVADESYACLLGAEHSVVGYECDGCEWSLDKDGLPAPTCRDGTPASFQILCTAPAIWAPGDAWWREDWDQERVGSGCMGVYTNDAGGEVFTAGSTDWPHGEPERPSQHVYTISHLNDCIGSPG